MFRRFRRRHTQPLDAASDAQLLAEAKSNPDAFGEFYDRHYDMVLGYFLNRTADGEVAADLTAETFAAAFSSSHRYRNTGAPTSAWLVGIARNHLKRFYRTAEVATRARQKLGMAQSVDLTADQIDNIEQQMDRALLMPALQRAWNTLSDNVADAVRLRVLEELSYSDIADELGCTAGAARTRVCRGLAALQNHIEQAHHIPPTEPSTPHRIQGQGGAT